MKLLLVVTPPSIYQKQRHWLHAPWWVLGVLAVETRTWGASQMLGTGSQMKVVW